MRPHPAGYADASGLIDFVSQRSPSAAFPPESLPCSSAASLRCWRPIGRRGRSCWGWPRSSAAGRAGVGPTGKRSARPGGGSGRDGGGRRPGLGGRRRVGSSPGGRPGDDRRRGVVRAGEAVGPAGTRGRPLPEHPGGGPGRPARLAAGDVARVSAEGRPPDRPRAGRRGPGPRQRPGRPADRRGRGRRRSAVSRAGGDHPGQDSFRMPPELAGPLRATTAADGSFAIKGIPEGRRARGDDRRPRVRRRRGSPGIRPGR